MLNFFLKLFGTPDTAEGKEPMLNLVLPMMSLTLLVLTFISQTRLNRGSGPPAS